MKQKAIEVKGLGVSAIINFIMAGAGFWIFLITDIQALFLDFFFSLIAALSCVAAIIISNVSKRRTKYYPYGIHFLEPLYAIFKSTLTLSLLVVSVIETATTAYVYFSQGVGQPMQTGPVLPYALIMVILCFGLGFFNRYQNRKMNNVSTILTAESESNFIDGIISLGVGVAIIPLAFIPLDSSLGFLHYTGDFFITTILVLFSIKEPIKVLFSSFRELSGGKISDKKIQEAVLNSVSVNFSGIKSFEKCNIFKVGTKIEAQILLNSETLETEHEKAISARDKIRTELLPMYEDFEIVFCF